MKIRVLFLKTLKEKDKIMDLIIQNTGNKQMYLYSGLTPSKSNHLYYEFDELELDVDSGEYIYGLIENELSGVSYIFKNEFLETEVIYSGETYTLRDLKPLIGVMRVGTIEEKAKYAPSDNKVTYYYRSKKKNQ